MLEKEPGQGVNEAGESERNGVRVQGPERKGLFPRGSGKTLLPS